MLTLTKPERIVLQRHAKIVLARKSFWHYCKAVDPDFYRDDRPHLVALCTTLNNFSFGLPLDSTGKVYSSLMINMPPRFGKTRTLVHWTDWSLGRNNEERIITWSYNDETAGDFSRYARDGIVMEKLDPDDLVFSDIFPNTKIKQGNASSYKWALEGQHFNYLGAGVGGSVTSKGGTVQLVDDPIKGAEEALNESHCDKVWQSYTSTFLSRIEPQEKETLKIMCMTRWSKGDPCGRLLEMEPGEWYVLKMEAMNRETGEMLCPEFLSREKYEGIKRLMMDEIFMANYHQEAIDLKGKMYPALKTYDALPVDKEGMLLFDRIGAYIDTADEGDDFLSCGIYLEYMRKAYMLDVYYTKDGMEKTEPETARRLAEFNVNVADVESNSGGRGFARAIKRILAEQGKTGVIVHWFHQSKNKQSRIYSESANVMENILFPADWKQRWPQFYRDMTGYSKEGKNAHDDAPDMVTGIAEKIGSAKMRVLK